MNDEYLKEIVKKQDQRGRPAKKAFDKTYKGLVHMAVNDKRDLTYCGMKRFYENYSFYGNTIVEKVIVDDWRIVNCKTCKNKRRKEGAN